MPGFFPLRWNLVNFLPGWPGTRILWISASQVAKAPGFLISYLIANLYNSSYFPTFPLLNESARCMGYKSELCTEILFCVTYDGAEYLELANLLMLVR
jgi:hypothetical protein